DALCAASKAAAYKLVDLDPRFFRHYESNRRRYAGIGKLSVRINDDHTFELTYLGGGETFNGVSGGRVNGNPDTGVFGFSEPSQTHDLIGHYIGKFLAHKLQVDARLGWHYESDRTDPTAIGLTNGFVSDTRSLSLQTFEGAVEPCKSQKLVDNMEKDRISFNP